VEPKEDRNMNEHLKRFDLTGRIAVVTGASEGIGRELAIGLAGGGADVIACSRREEKIREVKNEIEKMGRRSEFFVTDVSKVRSIEELKDFIVKKFGKVDILVNNAAFTVTKPAWDVTEEEWDAMLDTSLKGVFFCSKIIGSIMRSQKYGKVINLSSTFSRSTFVGRAVYCAIKAGVSRLTEVLATEWAPDGVRVNAIAPTAVLTPSRAAILKGDNLKRILSRIPLGRLTTPEDLVSAAIYLSSPASDFVTGQTLFVDGGWVAAS
jgi:2-deoxy-D-gluconate 3-dehydrogenase